MQKDFKIGMTLGLVLVAAFALWLSTRPSLSIKARMLEPYSAVHRDPALREPHKMGIPPQSHSSARPVKETLIDGNLTEQTEPLIAIGKPAQGDELKLPEFSANEQPEEGSRFDFGEPSRVAGTQIKTERFHIVCLGETLSGISYKYYGSTNKWQKIYNANRETIENPNRIKPGMRLNIPD
jgi:nucleoid-associated protein YgaU